MLGLFISGPKLHRLNELVFFRMDFLGWVPKTGLKCGFNGTETSRGIRGQAHWVRGLPKAYGTYLLVVGVLVRGDEVRVGLLLDLEDVRGGDYFEARRPPLALLCEL